MEKCACPWCDKPVDGDFKSLMGAATCRDHSWEAILEAIRLRARAQDKEPDR